MRETLPSMAQHTAVAAAPTCRLRNSSGKVPRKGSGHEVRLEGHARALRHDRVARARRLQGLRLRRSLQTDRMKKNTAAAVWVAMRWGDVAKGEVLVGVWDTEEALRAAHPEAYRRFDILGNLIPRERDARADGVDYWREEVRS